MLHLKASLIVGSNRHSMYKFLKRYKKVLVVCNSRILDQWMKALEWHHIDASVIKSADLRDNGIDSTVEFDLIVIEDYPGSIHLPTDRYGASTMNSLYELSNSRNFDILEIV